MITLTRSDIQSAFDAAFPDVTGDGTTCYVNKDALIPITWSDMNGLLRQVGSAPFDYNIDDWNCADNSRWVILEVKKLWKKKNKGALACGVLEGDVPLDGDNGNIGWHSIGFIIDPDKKLWLVGCYERDVMNASAVAEVKDIEYAGTGG